MLEKRRTRRDNTERILLWPADPVFFTQHLQQNRRVSPQTVASYRDTLKLLLQFVKEQSGKEPSALCVKDLDSPVILSFLDHLEEQRRNCISSRNVRLAAIRTFFRWVALRDPENVGLATRVMAIPQKRADKKLVQALSRTEMDAILAAPDLTNCMAKAGRNEPSHCGQRPRARFRPGSVNWREHLTR